MVDMHMNSRGHAHSLRLLVTDYEAGVWEALIDGDEYFYFEADPDTATWQLFGIAVEAYLGYIGERDLSRTEWRTQ